MATYVAFNILALQDSTSRKAYINPEHVIALIESVKPGTTEIVLPDGTVRVGEELSTVVAKLQMEMMVDEATGRSYAQC
jgi:MOSC domain-containing protein YiiM